MPGIAGKISSSNICHVMIRGINRQNIFEEDDDRICFMKILGYCKEISGYSRRAVAREEKAALNESGLTGYYDDQIVW